MSLLRHIGTLLRMHARPHPCPCIYDASGQRDAHEQIAAYRFPVVQRKDTDRICGRVTRCSISNFVTAGQWPRSGYRVVAPDLGGAQGVRAQFPGPPTKQGPPTMFMCLAICTTCAWQLVTFISEESLFVDAKISVVQTAVFHLCIIWYCDETTITLIVFLKVGQVSESSECKAKPRRTH